jgi:hypothetical protein
VKTLKQLNAEGWRHTALHLMAEREKESAAMNALADLVEAWAAGTGDEALMLLGFHHVAMQHGSYARKKTLRKALKSSIEELSKVAPAIFPPDRVPKQLKRVRMNAGSRTESKPIRRKSLGVRHEPPGE